MTIRTGEYAVRANQEEARRLLSRGVAAARGGQRRVAAGLLTRAVQLDPQNEGAWLWLSGVLDDPEQVAFCLRSVLAINPHSERARRGIAYLEARGSVASGSSRPLPAVPAVQPEEVPAISEARHHGEAWWVNWRRSRQLISRVRLMVWLVPIVLLMLVVPLHESLVQAVEQRNAQVATVLTAPPTPVPAPAPPAQLARELEAQRHAAVLAYLSEVMPPRERLAAAVENYRRLTGQPGGASVAHAAATQTLREEVVAARQALATVTPPVALAAAHEAYLSGLSIEIAALDDLLGFYASYDVALANRAALRFQQAGLEFERARSAFDLQQQAATSGQPVRTAR